MTKHCDNCEDQLYSDDAGMHVGQSYICQSCFDEGMSYSMDEMSMWLNQVFGGEQFQVAKAA